MRIRHVSGVIAIVLAAACGPVPAAHPEPPAETYTAVTFQVTIVSSVTAPDRSPC